MDTKTQGCSCGTVFITSCMCVCMQVKKQPGLFTAIDQTQKSRPPSVRKSEICLCQSYAFFVLNN